MFNIPEVCKERRLLSNSKIKRYNRGMNLKTRRQDDAEHTKKALLKRAQHLFAEDGYAKTSIDEIVRQEQLTKGALYYHFKDKKNLFEHVVDGLLEEMVKQVSTAIDTESDPWERTLIAIETYLEGCLNHDYRRIVIQEAPVILGWTKWREKEKLSVRGLSTVLIKELMESKYIKDQPIDLLAYIIFGAITEAAIGIAHSDDPHAARKQAKDILEKLVKAL
ncbi:TetR/AcrR family transcriptional regulator [Paenibacillus paridis]|uniref:TetR/AcrR family transcriptional regulator n=1 Tax=Paenibacillus paridis TaxID=2583376 RepID=UPI001EE411A6|nr:TetR/AcrR family transcriptional regulator [Paenibacillus paridis]